MRPDVRPPARGVHVLPDTGPPARSRATAEAVAVLHRSARDLMEDLPQLTGRILAELREREPAYRAALEADPDCVWQQVHNSLRNNVRSFLHPREARTAARRCSWEIGAVGFDLGLPLDALLHAFRIGGALVWQDLIEHTARRNGDDVRLLVHIAADVWNFVDEQCRMVADAYHHVQRAVTWRRENRLRLMAEALLDGTTRVADLPEIANALALPEDGPYAVVAVGGDHRPGAGADGSPLPDLPPGVRVLWHRGTGTDHGIALLDGGGTAALAARLALPPRVRAGVSSAVRGLAALGEARRLADTALRCGSGGGGGVIRLEDRLPAALVLSSPDIGAVLADRVLGPVRSLEPADREMLLDTLTVWLDCDGSAPRAAERLYCHRNTVLNRLRRCEQLTGRSLTRPADLAELSLALEAGRLLGG